jgi:hypothetical protein
MVEEDYPWMKHEAIEVEGGDLRCIGHQKD